MINVNCLRLFIALQTCISKSPILNKAGLFLNNWYYCSGVQATTESLGINASTSTPFLKIFLSFVFLSSLIIKSKIIDKALRIPNFSICFFSHGIAVIECSLSSRYVVNSNPASVTAALDLLPSPCT